MFTTPAAARAAGACLADLGERADAALAALKKARGAAQWFFGFAGNTDEKEHAVGDATAAANFIKAGLKGLRAKRKAQQEKAAANA